MDSWLDHGSGIIIIIACASGRPARTSSSRVLSNIDESSRWVDDREDLLDVVAEELGLSKSAWRACIQLMLPRSVLISPLWAM
jgi:hypothetical protein